MKANVDKDTCIGCGLCNSICPSVFEMMDDGKAEAICEASDDMVESLLEAVGTCPVSAISVE